MLLELPLKAVQLEEKHFRLREGHELKFYVQ